MNSDTLYYVIASAVWTATAANYTKSTQTSGKPLRKENSINSLRNAVNKCILATLWLNFFKVR